MKLSGILYRNCLHCCFCLLYFTRRRCDVATVDSKRYSTKVGELYRNIIYNEIYITNVRDEYRLMC